MRGDIDGKRFTDAILVGENHLASKAAEDRAEVQKLLVEARYGRARERDTPEGYRDFLKANPKSAFESTARAELARSQYDTYTIRTDTLEAYEAYLAEFPQGPSADKARDRAATLAFRKADATGTRESYKRFRDDYPRHRLASDALRKEKAVAFQAAEKDGSPEAYLGFSAVYPGTDEAESAIQIARRRAWEEARKAGTPEAFVHVAELFPGTELASNAESRADELAWPVAERSATIERYRWFRRLLPRSPHAAEARVREARLAWQQAEQEDSESAYESIVDEYPELPEIQLAERRLLDWRAFEGSTSEGGLRATVNQINDLQPGIKILVDVRRPDGTYQAGIPRSAFHAYENGRRAEIVDFLGMESNRPVDVVMAVDVSGSMVDEIDAVKESAIEFAEQLRFRQRDSSFGLITFVDSVEKQFGGTLTSRNAAEFRRWVSTVRVVNKGTENPVQALRAASGYQFRRGAQKVFILLTDEEPNVPFDPKSRMTTQQVAEKMAKEQVTFFAITPNLPVYEQMTQATRGVLFDIEAASQGGGFRELMMRIADLLSMQYQLTYKSPRGIGPGEARDIRVRVDQERIWVSTGSLDKGEIVALIPDVSHPCGLTAVTRNQGLHATRDCGTTWSPSGLPGLPALEWARALGTSGTGGELYLLSTTGRLFVVTGSGATERTPSGASVRDIAWDPEHLLRVWLLVGNKVRRSDDAAETLADFAPLPGLESPEAIAADPHVDGRVCVVDRHKGVYCTGATGAWEPRRGARGPSTPWNAGVRLEFCPFRKDLAYLLHPGDGVYRSLSGGASWMRTQIASGGGGSFAVGPMTFGTADHRLTCHVSTMGVYCSRDDGASWGKVEAGFDASAPWLPALAYLPNRGVFVVGGKAGTVYKLFEVANREYISGNVYFDVGQDQPHASLVPFVLKIGRALKQDPSLRVTVEGHTDADGSDADNMALSIRRAESVKRILLQAGAAEAQIRIAGHGKTRPLFPNTSPRNKERNRRVELVTLRDMAEVN